MTVEGGGIRTAQEFGNIEATIPGDVVTGAMSVGTVNDALCKFWVPSNSFVVNVLYWRGGGASGNYDIGIYDAAGNRLWRKGTTAAPAASTDTDEVVNPGVAVSKGTPYILAWGADSATPQVHGITLASTKQELDYLGNKRAFIIAGGYAAASGGLITPINPAAGTVLGKIPKLMPRVA